MRYRLLSNSTEACLLAVRETLIFHSSLLIGRRLLPITRRRRRRCSLSSSSPPPSSSGRPWHLLSFHTSASPQGRYIPLTDVEKYSVTDMENFEQLSSDDSENEVEDGKNVAHLQKAEKQYLVVNFYVLVDVEDPKLEVARHSSFMEVELYHHLLYFGWGHIDNITSFLLDENCACITSAYTQLDS